MNRSFVVVVTLSAGLTACGGSSGLNKADLAKKANAICVKAEKQLKSIQTPSNVQDASAAAAYFDKVTPLAVAETTSLKALTPASSIKADWNAFIAKQSAATDLLSTIRDKADKKDASGLQDLQKLSPLAGQITAAAKKVGATSCT